MKRNIALCFEYDGTGFIGSQWQAAGRSVQAELEAAWTRLTSESQRFQFAGRTDTGVHALAQVANAPTATNHTLNTIVRALNALTSDDVTIHAAWEMPAEFNARFNARQRSYRYLLDVAATPAATLRSRATYIDRPLDTQAMSAALTHLVGEHDFRAFAGAGQPGSTVRTISAATLEPQTLLGRPVVGIVLSANGFLRHMVRNIIGTLLMVGQNQLAAQDVVTILASQDRRQAGPTAPPHGLYLETISYDPAFAPLHSSERWDHVSYWRTHQAAPLAPTPQYTAG